MATVQITESNVDAILESNRIVILDFWAGWCGPCKMFAPTFERVSDQFPDIVFGKVDVEAEKALAVRFKTRAIPTTMVIRDGVRVMGQSGMLQEQALTRLVEDALADN